MSNWYQLEAQQVVQDLNTDASTGLKQNEVSRRLQFGVNELAERGLKSPWQIIWEQLTASTVVILLVAALVSTLLGDYKDTVAILAIVLLSAGIGFNQEYRASQAFCALKKLAVPREQNWRARIIHANNQLAQMGIRVLGVAFRQWEALPEVIKIDSIEQNLVFIGLVGMIDPPRAEVKQAVEICKVAGIRLIMITGDHPLNAQHIAQELGITSNTLFITGLDLNQLQAKELIERVKSVSVYARVSPDQKLRIIEALQQQGHIVAMTGDGVNDAPALRKADIGVAMGVMGTDVAKEAADMVLLDDNFATIVAAIKEGRVIYDNIRKSIKYLLSSNSGEIWVMLLAPLLGMPLPLLPIQILWINLMTDGLPALALSVEPAEENIMNCPPHSPKENIFGRGMGWEIIWIGLMLGLLCLGIGYWYWQIDHEASWQTMLFTVLTFSEIAIALALRSERDSLFQIGLFSNPQLLAAVVLTFGLQLAVIYVPFLQEVFQSKPLSLRDLVLSVVVSTTVFWLVELKKLIVRRKLFTMQFHSG